MFASPLVTLVAPCGLCLVARGWPGAAPAWEGSRAYGNLYPKDRPPAMNVIAIHARDNGISSTANVRSIEVRSGILCATIISAPAVSAMTICPIAPTFSQSYSALHCLSESNLSVQEVAIPKPTKKYPNSPEKNCHAQSNTCWYKNLDWARIDWHPVAIPRGTHGYPGIRLARVHRNSVSVPGLSSRLSPGPK